ncbi:hypothetical protein HHL17_03975 [Chitinophaga sp. G-6-1-13]|uniref:VCBS repeat-containing protein n=1 Tax=Chitinophaga fulva TaxID=2728842 RepID=A0A848GKD6_9BACT|nr:hypothetical protein [Chitinophaga fulva]NML36348.1 hypothetical protein [Chitinophaga fulva]
MIPTDMRLPIILILLLATACTMRYVRFEAPLVTHFKEAKQVSLTGDFDGDGKADTLIQQLRLMGDGSPVDSVPDPEREEYDSIVKYYFDKEIALTIALSSKSGDTILLSSAMGTYCLINLGDNNADGKDEVALVPDLPDYSNLNTCHIYTLCGKHWTELNSFGINEGGFTFTSDTVFKTIPGYLEKRAGKWMYQDSTETFRSLILSRCPDSSH